MRVTREFRFDVDSEVLARLGLGHFRQEVESVSVERKGKDLVVRLYVEKQIQTNGVFDELAAENMGQLDTPVPERVE